MRGGSSWETQPLDPSNEGHERDTSAVAKGGKSLPLSLSFPLLICLAFPPRPHLSFSLPPLALLLGYLCFSSSSPRRFFKNACVCVCVCLRLLPSYFTVFDEGEQNCPAGRQTGRGVEGGGCL